MKFSRQMKFVLFTSLSTLYFSGVLVWALGHWFLTDNGFGPEPSAMRTFWLQIHSVIGLWFLALFGYLFHSHVRPAWRRRRKLKTGASLTAVLIFLCATVPGIFYLTNQIAKSYVAAAHTYVGLFAVVIFLIHYFI